MFNLFKKKDNSLPRVDNDEAKKIVTTFIKDNESNIIISADVIYNNRFIDICSNACSICWDKVPPESNEDKLNYLKKRIKSGHTSILEHSNIVTRYEIIVDDNQLNKAMEVLDYAHYLYKKTNVKSLGDNKFYIEVILSGSLRGYYYLIDNGFRYRESNIMMQAILSAMYEFYSELFEVYIEDKVMDKERFKTVYTDKEKSRVFTSVSDRIDYDRSIDNFVPEELTHVTIENVDNLYQIFSGINSHKMASKYYKYDDSIYIDDALDYTTITILFKNMSRTATHQLVRHRNAITQESQRYVDYSNAGFTSPDSLTDKYIKDKKYEIELSTGYKNSYTLSELGKEMTNVYCQLVGSPSEGKLLKEDARAFLPSNIQCGKLYMTFTLRNLFKFFELRTAPSAQAEIRMYANEILDWWNNVYTERDNNKNLKYDPAYNVSKYKLDSEEFLNIDEEIK